MMLKIMALILAVLSLVAGQKGQDKSKESSSKRLAGQITEIENAHKNLQKKFYADLSTYRKDNEKISQLNKDYNEAASKLAEKLKALVKAHGKESACFDGFLVYVCEIRYPLDDDMVQTVLQHHLANPKMGRLCEQLGYRSTEDWAERLLKETAAKHPMKAVQGQAIYYLGEYYRYKAFPWGRTLSESEEKKWLNEAERYYKQVVESYASAATPDLRYKLGDKAKNQLIRIKNLPNLKIGKPAPEIIGQDIDGKEFKLSDYRGKVVVLDFWGHW